MLPTGIAFFKPSIPRTRARPQPLVNPETDLPSISAESSGVIMDANERNMQAAQDAPPPATFVAANASAATVRDAGQPSLREMAGPPDGWAMPAAVMRHPPMMNPLRMHPPHVTRPVPFDQGPPPMCCWARCACCWTAARTGTCCTARLWCGT